MRSGDGLRQSHRQNGSLIRSRRPRCDHSSKLLPRKTSEMRSNISLGWDLELRAIPVNERRINTYGNAFPNWVWRIYRVSPLTCLYPLIRGDICGCPMAPLRLSMHYGPTECGLLLFPMAASEVPWYTGAKEPLRRLKESP